MKPAPFRYVRAESLDHALETLAAVRDAKVLAGGQSLVPALNMRLVRPAALVDMNRVCDLGNATMADGTLAVGAMVRQSDPRLLGHPLLAEALPHVGHFVTRNRGTVAGSIAHADPAAELPVCFALLGGSARAASTRGQREIAAGELFLAPYTTALEPDEVLVETRWPAPREGSGYAFCELSQRRGDFALCMAAAAVHGSEVRVVVGSVVDRPTVLELDLEHPGESAAAQVEPWGTMHASPTYLKHLVRELVDRAVALARKRATS